MKNFEKHSYTIIGGKYDQVSDRGVKCKGAVDNLFY